MGRLLRKRCSDQIHLHNIKLIKELQILRALSEEAFSFIKSVFSMPILAEYIKIITGQTKLKASSASLRCIKELRGSV
ncbi:hypothetical protein PO124_19640 [Bacillus licheniformis]|nr:hypothetical protein [Bacillus licheniformis]